MSNEVSVRVFNENGISEFEQYLNEVRLNNAKELPKGLLFEDKYSFPLEPFLNVELVNFTNKNELVPYLVNKFRLRANKHLYFNQGLWTWLSALYFAKVCPMDSHGNRKVNETALYVLRDPKNYTKYYRHLLAYPCRVYSELGDDAKIFLVGPFTKRGEITEQLGAYQDLALNKGIIGAAGKLYWDDDKKSIRKGAAGKGAGSIRRLVRIIRQYKMTYDLGSMKSLEIVELLPNEFSKWRS